MAVVGGAAEFLEEEVFNVAGGFSFWVEDVGVALVFGA